MAEQKKKRSFRKEYLNDFQRDINGRYVYMGRHMIYDGERSSWKREVVLYWVACVLPALFLIAFGCIPGSGLFGNILLVLPFTLDLIGMFIIIWKLVRMSWAGIRMRNYVYEQTVRVIPVYAWITAAIAVFGIIGLVISVALGNYQGKVYAIILYLAEGTVTGIGNVFLAVSLKKMPWKEE